MRSTATSLVIALVVLGCDSTYPASEQVGLLTGVQSCYAGGQSPTNGGLLVPDPQFGTRFDGQGPVMWPVGYTARRLRTGEIAVLNTSGGLVATTGKRYRYSPVPEQPGEAGRVMARVGAIPVCDSYPWDLEEAWSSFRPAA
jgi:hypothetical protein